MINVNQLIQPLRIWTSRDYTLSNRHLIGKQNELNSIVVDKNTITPFIVTRIRYYETQSDLYDQHPITEVNLFDLNTGQSTNIVSYCSFYFGYTGIGNKELKEHIVCVISNNLSLRQGLYYLEIKDAYNHTGYSANTWYTENFRVGVYENTIRFKYRLTGNKNFGDVWSYPHKIDGEDFYYKLELRRALSYDEGNFNTFSETVTDKEQNTVYGRERFRKLRVCALMGDSNVIDCMQLIRRISNMYEGEVYLRDETGYENLVQIEDITAERQSGNYLTIYVTYSLKDSDIINLKNQIISLIFKQEGTVISRADDVLKIGEKELELGGQTLEI